MRLAVLVLLGGCQIPFPLDRAEISTVERRGASTSQVQNTDTIDLVRPPDVDDGDVVIVKVTATASKAISSTQVPPGFAPVWVDFNACGIASRSTLIFEGKATTDPLHFAFSDLTTFDAALVAYAGAQAPVARRLQPIINAVGTPTSITFEGYQLAPHSVALLAADCAIDCLGQTGIDGEPVSNGAETGVFEIATEDGAVPDRALVIPPNTCAHVADLSLEPLAP